MADGRRRHLAVLFAVYLAVLVWIILWKLQVPYIGDGSQRAIKLVPFVATAANGPSNPLEVAVNLVLFAPFGAYMGLLAKRWRWWQSGLAAAGASLALEVSQYALAVGSSDITDLICNTVGALAGFAALSLVRRRAAPSPGDIGSAVAATDAPIPAPTPSTSSAPFASTTLAVSSALTPSRSTSPSKSSVSTPTPATTRADRLAGRTCAIVTIVLVVLAVLFVISPFQFHSPDGNAPRAAAPAVVVDR